MPRNLYRVGSIWYYRGEKNGQTIRRSLETDVLSVAQERAEKIRREITGPKWGERPTRTFDDAARRFAQEHFPLLKPSARRRYVISLERLADHFHKVNLGDIGSARLGDFERARLASGVTTATVRRDLACLSSLFTRAEEWEWAEKNPIKGYLRSRQKYLPDSVPRTRYLSMSEELLVLEHAPPKAREAIAFAIDTGLRRGEHFRLLEGDIDMARNELTVRAEIAKSNKARTIPLLPRTREWLLGRPRGLPHMPVFRTIAGGAYSPTSPTMYEALQKAVRRAGISEHVEWHDLRRTCGCRLLQQRGLSFEEVSTWLGHSGVKITQERYAFLHVDQLHDALRPGERITPFR